MADAATIAANVATDNEFCPAWALLSPSSPKAGVTV
jgi:hypothetical protein